jgi:DNA-binding transcriptional ArsR family regulator
MQESSAASVRAGGCADLADTLPISRPAVSQHLKILKTAGLVIDERAGARRIYRVDQSGLRRMPGRARDLLARHPLGVQAHRRTAWPHR